MCRISRTLGKGKKYSNVSFLVFVADIVNIRICNKRPKCVVFMRLQIIEA